MANIPNGKAGCDAEAGRGGAAEQSADKK